MELDSSFTVVAPIESVWDVLMDFDRVAASVPGAEILNKLSDEAFQVGMKVKLGPVTLQYKGLVNVQEINQPEHRAVFGGKAQETRGQGTIDGSATLTLSEADGTTTGLVHAELSLSGKAATMGKSVINSVTQQMMGLFAENLQAMVLDGASSEDSAPIDTDRSDVADQPATGTPVSAPRPAPVRPPTPLPPRAPAPADNSLDALGLVRGIVTDQLSSPGKLVGLLAIVAFVGYLVGRGGAQPRGGYRGGYRR